MPASKPAQPRPAPSPPAPSPDHRSTLHATAQLLTFQPGLYAVDFAAPRSAATDTGLSLPCVRLEPIPTAPAFPGRAFVSVLAEGGWLSQGSEPGFVRAVGGRAGVILTIYKAGLDMAAPELRIRLLPETARRGAAAPVPAQAAPSGGAFVQMAHLQGRGDVRAAAGEWVGQAGGRVPLEGFSLTPAEGAGAEDPARALEYQAILGDQWNTPWMRAGQFCGSRGMALPILGVRVRLAGAAAEGHECHYWGSFVGRPALGPCRDGEACAADGAFMEALRVVVVPRAAAVPVEGMVPAGAVPAGEVPVGAPPPVAAAPAGRRRTGARVVAGAVQAGAVGPEVVPVAAPPPTEAATARRRPAGAKAVTEAVPGPAGRRAGPDEAGAAAEAVPSPGAGHGVPARRSRKPRPA